jgi:ATP-dependent Clp protease ATP-binding subunit ClpC
MDEAGSRCRIAASIRPPEFKSAEAEIETIRADKEAAIKAQDFEKAAALLGQPGYQKQRRTFLEMKKFDPREEAELYYDLGTAYFLQKENAS